MRLSLCYRAFLLLATTYSLATAECDVTVTSEAYSCDAILTSVPSATCDECYLFCNGEYSGCISSLDEANCGQTIMASVCGDEQRLASDNGGSVAAEGSTSAAASPPSPLVTMPLFAVTVALLL